MKRTVGFLVVFIMICGILATFQPNPAAPLVVGKADEKITESENAAAGIPGSVQNSLNQGKQTVNIDAQVELPGTLQIPVVKVAPDKFTQEQADKIIQTLMQGKPIYEPGGEKTKAQLEQELVGLKAQLENAPDGGRDSKIAGRVEEINKALASAPETVQKQPAIGKFQAEEGFNGQQIKVVSNLGKVNDALLSINASESGKIGNVWFTNEDMYSPYNLRSALNGTPRGMEMTLEEAQALAIKTAEDMGSDLKLAAVMLGTQGMLGLKNAPSTVNENAPQAYIFWFTREVEGVPTTYETNEGAMVEVPEDDAAKASFEPYPYERMYMVIDDTGIVELHWTSPVKILETISLGAQILPFDQVMEIFEQQFFIRNALKENDGDIKQYTYTVDRITLGLTRIPVEDKPNEYMLVPVWDFFGALNTEFNDQNKMSEVSDYSATSFLTINAIDGSLIDRASGN